MILDTSTLHYTNMINSKMFTKTDPIDYPHPRD